MDNKMFFFFFFLTLIDVNKDIYEITDASKVAMDELKSNGHDVFLSTGRCKCFIVDGVSSYPFSGYVTCNGGHVSYKGKTLYKTVIEPEAIMETMNLCSQYDMNYYFPCLHVNPLAMYNVQCSMYNYGNSASFCFFACLTPPSFRHSHDEMPPSLSGEAVEFIRCQKSPSTREACGIFKNQLKL